MFYLFSTGREHQAAQLPRPECPRHCPGEGHVPEDPHPHRAEEICKEIYIIMNYIMIQSIENTLLYLEKHTVMKTAYKAC